MPTRIPHRHHHDHYDEDDDDDDLHHLPSLQPKSDPKFLFALLKFIIMLLILSLFLLFLGIAAIALFHILLAVSFLHCRRRHHHRRSPFSAASTPTAAALAYRFDDLKKHLPPPFNYAPGASNNTDCCWICLENFKQAESCRSLPMCNHLFHVNCVDQWLTKVPNCPVCRTQLRFSPNRLSDHRVQW